MKNVGKKIVNTAKKVVKTVVNTVKNVARTVVNAVKQTAKTVRNAVTHTKTYQYVKNRVTSSGTYQKIVSKGSNFIRNVGSGLQKAGKTYTSFQSYVAERRAEIRAEVVRQMCTTADRISEQLGKVDWKKVGIAVVATGAAIGVGVLTGGVGIAAVGALGLTEGTLGAAIVGGAVTGAIGGATYSGVSSGLSGNSLKQVAKDTLTGGLTGAVAGGAMGGLAYGADKAIGAVKNVIKGSSSSPKPGHITEMAKRDLSGGSAQEEGITVKLKYKEGWTDAQKAEANAKVKALSEADTVKRNVERSGTSSRKMYIKAFGKDSVSSTQDIDHIVDLQLGGKNELSNLAPLDRSVNRSLGAQIKNAIKDYPEETRFGKFVIE